jgi:hypothetical protein
MIAPKPHITYAQLLEKLNSLPKERLEDTVTIYDATNDQYQAVFSLAIAGSHNDVLDEGHLYLACLN